MKNISLYILEKFNIKKELTNDQIKEYLDKIFPIEDNKEIWETCKYMRVEKEYKIDTNTYIYTYGSLIKFNDDFLLEVYDSYTQENWYGGHKDSKPKITAKINVLSECDELLTSYIKKDKSIKFAPDILGEILEKYAKKENKVKSVKELNVGDLQPYIDKKYKIQ